MSTENEETSSSARNQILSNSLLEENEYFKFISDGYAENTFIVSNFKGLEGISTLYDFEITLLTQLPDSDADLPESEKNTTLIISSDTLLIHPAVFIIKHPDVFTTALQINENDNDDDNQPVTPTYTTLYDKIPDTFKDDRNAYFYGYPVSFTQGVQNNGWTFYTIRLRPAIDKLNHLTQNTVFTNSTVKEIVESVLENSNSISIDYNFNYVDTNFPVQEFSLQNNETSFDFISAKLEHDGIYYYFSQNNNLERINFMDDKLKHPNNNIVNSLTYKPGVSASKTEGIDIVTSFTEVHTAVPKTVYLRDYNWLNPNTPVEASATISDTGIGEVYLYGEGFTTTTEGERLAKLRAEEILCRSYNYIATSDVPKLRPGYLFTLEGHYSARFNKQYMITDLFHEGSQESLISTTLNIVYQSEATTVYYANSFHAIPSDVQFRPKRSAQRKTVSGLITAFVGSLTEDGSSLDTDEYGRYKIDFPQSIVANTTQNLANLNDASTSCMVRRAQPSVGPVSGSVYPIYPGTEVLIGFSDGHPDKPIILSPVNNTETSFAGQDGTGFSSINNSEIVLNLNGIFRTQNGVGDVITASQDSLSNYGNATQIVNGLNASLATLSSTATSSYKADLGVDTSALTLSLKTLAAVGTAMGNAFSATDVSKKGLNITGLTLESLAKILPIALSVMGDIKPLFDGVADYQASLTNSKEKSSVAFEADLDITSMSLISASIAAHIGSTLTSTVMSSVDKNDSVDQYNKEKDAADANIKKLKEVDTKITEIETQLADPNITMEEKLILQVQKGEYEDLKQELEARKEQDTYDANNKMYEKRMLKAGTIIPDIFSMISEGIAIAMLILTKTRRSKNPLGGLKVASSDNNVIVSAYDELKLISGKQIFIGANPNLHNMSDMYLDEMYTATDSPAWGTGQICGTQAVAAAPQRLAMVSKHVLSGAENINRLLSLDEININSRNKISITNKQTDKTLEDAQKLITIKEKGDSIAVPQGLQDYPNAEISMDNSDANANIFSVSATHANNHLNSLIFNNTKSSLNYQKDTIKSDLLLGDDSVLLSYDTGTDTEKTTATLEKQKITLKANDVEVILDSDTKKISLIADTNSSIVLNADGDLTTKAKTMTTTTTGATTIESDSFTATCGSMKIKLTSSGCDILDKLSVKASTVQIG